MPLSSKWLYVRLSLFALCGSVTAFMPTPDDPDLLHPMPFRTVATAFGFTIIGIPLAISWKLRRLDEEIQRPSWFVNPFVRRQPFVFFDFASWLFLAMGVGGAAAKIIGNRGDWFWEGPLISGIGAWLGVRVAMAVDSGKLTPNQSKDPTP